MILTGPEIQQRVAAGDIRISPFDPAQVTTNSYDLRLGKKLVRYTADVLDALSDNAYEVIDIPEDGYVMQPGDFALAATLEEVGSDRFVPLLHGKSGMARKGLFAHITADLIDLGFIGHLTLQLYATLPVRIYPGMRIAQASFWVPKGDINITYKGRLPEGELPLV